MTDAVDSLPSGLTLRSGDHLCGFYRNDPERDAIVIPFIEDGLVNGSKCTCVVDSCTPAEVVERLSQDLDVTSHLEARMLEVLTAEETYLGQGSFIADVMLQFWESKGRASYGDTIPASPVRNLGDMSWAHRQDSCFDALINYEAEINRIMHEFPQINLCLYDLSRCSGEIVLDVLKTHPKVMLGGMVIENPYYLDAEEFLAERLQTR
jgi:hypothetical protein